MRKLKGKRLQDASERAKIAWRVYWHLWQGQIFAHNASDALEHISWVGCRAYFGGY